MAGDKEVLRDEIIYVGDICEPDPHLWYQPSFPPRSLTELPTLFHIPRGGRFYHLIDDCASVPEKYLPMAGFDTGRLDQEPFEGLAPCPFCIQ